MRSLGTYLGLEGGLTRPSFIVGFPQMVILITYDMKYFTMEAVSLASILAQNRPSSHMCVDVDFGVLVVVLMVGAVTPF